MIIYYTIIFHKIIQILKLTSKKIKEVHFHGKILQL
jgi:hypothetical protein